ncbi:hypothetical protein JR316_0007646 [Psilocybe cubensis]|uniref:Uncharacterized protein n=2 Tax=Psilocybe cubensis TaxID=181762 RepID=A0ACB8GUC9_PSICU|nr:hypothetical protein JR316_0007646 [Psilocybe cubensis]KAH9479069.1 hypothetical protein JR316_0007646 [Psilocybe cubensis]
MAQYQQESFVIPSNTILPGSFTSFFESDLGPEALLEQHLAPESNDDESLHQLQCGPSTVVESPDSHIPLSMPFSGFEGQNPGTSEFFLFHPTTEEEIRLLDSLYSSYPYTEEEILGENSWKAGTRASPQAHTESGWDTFPQDSLWPTNRAPVFWGDYPSSSMEALTFPATNEYLRSMPGPSTLPGTDDLYATANVETSIQNHRPFMPVSHFGTSTNQYGNDYQTFSNTIGEGLDNNIRSTGEQQTVDDQCSGDHPVEHDYSERNAHGRMKGDVSHSGLYGLNNASEWLPGAYESLEEEVPNTNAGTWTDESIVPEQPAPSTSQVQGHIPSCMGGLGVSVTRERKRRKEKGFRFVNLAAS